jgi:hypothetical protein
MQKGQFEYTNLIPEVIRFVHKHFDLLTAIKDLRITMMCTSALRRSSRKSKKRSDGKSNESTLSKRQLQVLSSRAYTFSMLSIIIPFTSETWALIFESLFISSGWSTQNCMCSFSLDLKWKVLNSQIQLDSYTLQNGKSIPHLKVCKSTGSKPNKYSPKFFVQTMCDGGICSASSITSPKIFLYPVQKCERDLSAEVFIGDNQICCTLNKQTEPQMNDRHFQVEGPQKTHLTHNPSRPNMNLNSFDLQVP